MKRTFIFSLLAIATTLVASAHAGGDKFSTYDLPSSKLHVYESGDPMGDVSFIVEGEKGLVVIEQPTFYTAIEEFATYTESLDKPIVKVVASYHTGGVMQYKSKLVTMPEAMVGFSKSEIAQGMIAKFTKAFGDAADFRPFAKVGTFKVPSQQSWGGVDFDITAGSTSDFPAASIQIDGDAFYTHFSPSKSHGRAMQFKSREAVEAMLAEMEKIEASGAKYIFGSHGAPASTAEVEFQIEYLNKVVELLDSCIDSDQFAQRLYVAYPGLPGGEGVKAIANNLYADEAVDADKEEVRTRMQDYFDSVSNLDMEIGRKLWADDPRISFISPAGHRFGFEEISNFFLKGPFVNFKSRELSSMSEVINIYGDSANVQLYWRFETLDANDKMNVGYGRETLLFQKIDGIWMLVHVHYSRMPEIK